MSCNFSLGQRVLCVDASTAPSVGPWFGDAPEKGAVYTIRGMHPTGKVVRGEEMIALYFKEIRRAFWPTSQGIVELGYWHPRFRALEERKTDISVFQEILARENRRAKERARA